MVFKIIAAPSNWVQILNAGPFSRSHMDCLSRLLPKETEGLNDFEELRAVYDRLIREFDQPENRFLGKDLNIYHAIYIAAPLPSRAPSPSGTFPAKEAPRTLNSIEQRLVRLVMARIMLASWPDLHKDQDLLKHILDYYMKGRVYFRALEGEIGAFFCPWVLRVDSILPPKQDVLGIIYSGAYAVESFQRNGVVGTTIEDAKMSLLEEEELLEYEVQGYWRTSGARAEGMVLQIEPPLNPILDQLEEFSNAGIQKIAAFLNRGDIHPVVKDQVLNRLRKYHFLYMPESLGSQSVTEQFLYAIAHSENWREMPFCQLRPFYTHPKQWNHLQIQDLQDDSQTRDRKTSKCLEEIVDQLQALVNTIFGKELRSITIRGTQVQIPTQEITERLTRFLRTVTSREQVPRMLANFMPSGFLYQVTPEGTADKGYQPLNFQQRLLEIECRSLRATGSALIHVSLTIAKKWIKMLMRRNEQKWEEAKSKRQEKMIEFYNDRFRSIRERFLRMIQNEIAILTKELEGDLEPREGIEMNHCHRLEILRRKEPNMKQWPFRKQLEKVKKYYESRMMKYKI